MPCSVVGLFTSAYFMQDVWAWGVGFGIATALTDYLGYQKGGEFTDLFKTINPDAAAVLAPACYLGLIILAKRESAQFIYFQF